MKMGSVWKGILLGAVSAFLVVVISSAFFAWLISEEILGLEHLDLASAAALILAGSTTGIVGGRGARRWMRTGAAGAGLLLLLLAVNLIGYGGSLSGILPCSILVLGSGAGTALAMGAGGGRKRRKYQIKKYRTG